MQTLIELYDERPLENVLGVEMFHPSQVVYICPDAVASDERIHKKLRAYFRHRGLKVELIFIKSSVYDTGAMLRTLRQVVTRYPDCTMDITGGTDAVLFAAGLLCAEMAIPVITYSRKRNRFYNIQNAAFAANLPCDVKFNVEDCFMMAGGSMRTGRVDNAILHRYLDDIDPFFNLYLSCRRSWVKTVTYLQCVSPSDPSGRVPLDVCGKYTVRGDHGARISAPADALHSLEEIGFISDLRIIPEESVSFRFRDEQIRFWLRDVGSVLELYIYKVCLETGLFHEVRTSAIVDWEGDASRNAVTNELDVMCTRGVTPYFISCKTSDVKTEALNELAILRDRFGGQVAKAAIVTAERGGSAMRNRAEELDIAVIDLNDLTGGRTEKRIRSLVQNV